MPTCLDRLLTTKSVENLLKRVIKAIFRCEYITAKINAVLLKKCLLLLLL